MFVIGGYALGLDRTTEIDAWGTYEELEDLRDLLLPYAMIGSTPFAERFILSRPRRLGKVFVDYEVIQGELKDAVYSLPDNSEGVLFNDYQVMLASKLTCCLIKLAVIDEVPNANPKHSADIQQLWPEGLVEAIEASPQHQVFYQALRKHLKDRYAGSTQE